MFVPCWVDAHNNSSTDFNGRLLQSAMDARRADVAGCCISSYARP